MKYKSPLKRYEKKKQAKLDRAMGIIKPKRTK
jgi:hypothetical protein